MRTNNNHQFSLAPTSVVLRVDREDEHCHDGFFLYSMLLAVDQRSSNIIPISETDLREIKPSF
jgi:hypothetical protein